MSQIWSIPASETTATFQSFWEKTGIGKWRNFSGHGVLTPYSSPLHSSIWQYPQFSGGRWSLRAPINRDRPSGDICQFHWLSLGGVSMRIGVFDFDGDAVFHCLIKPSFEPLKILPSDEEWAKAHTSRSCPFSARMDSSRFISHNRMVWSALAERRFPSDRNCKSLIQERCPWSLPTWFPVAASHTWIVPVMYAGPVTNVLPSGESASEFTLISSVTLMVHNSRPVDKSTAETSFDPLAQIPMLKSAVKSNLPSGLGHKGRGNSTRRMKVPSEALQISSRWDEIHPRLPPSYFSDLLVKLLVISVSPSCE